MAWYMELRIWKEIFLRSNHNGGPNKIPIKEKLNKQRDVLLEKCIFRAMRDPRNVTSIMGCKEERARSRRESLLLCV